MSVIHIVLFRFKPEINEDAVHEACDELILLKRHCIHPSSNQPYIVSVSGGKDNSPEGHQGGFTHAFVMEFASVGDRNYYVAKDPAHMDFVKKTGPLLADVRVVDYEKDVY